MPGASGLIISLLQLAAHHALLGRPHLSLRSLAPPPSSQQHTCGIDFFSAVYAAAMTPVFCCSAPGWLLLPTGPAQSVRALSVRGECGRARG